MRALVLAIHASLIAADPQEEPRGQGSANSAYESNVEHDHYLDGIDTSFATDMDDNELAAHYEMALRRTIRAMAIREDPEASDLWSRMRPFGETFGR